MEAGELVVLSQRQGLETVLVSQRQELEAVLVSQQQSLEAVLVVASLHTSEDRGRYRCLVLLLLLAVVSCLL